MKRAKYEIKVILPNGDIKFIIGHADDILKIKNKYPNGRLSIKNLPRE